MDPTVLFAPVEIAKKHAKRVLDAASRRPGHIFNLGHGVLPDSDPADLRRLVELVHERTLVAA
jgi:uroporphyrinogen decarboxylase